MPLVCSILFGHHERFQAVVHEAPCLKKKKKKTCMFDGLRQGCGSEYPRFPSNTNSQYWLGEKSHI